MSAVNIARSSRAPRNKLGFNGGESAGIPNSSQVDKPHPSLDGRTTHSPHNFGGAELRDRELINKQDENQTSEIPAQGNQPLVRPGQGRLAGLQRLRLGVLLKRLEVTAARFVLRLRIRQCGVPRRGVVRRVQWSSFRRRRWQGRGSRLIFFKVIRFVRHVCRSAGGRQGEEVLMALLFRRALVVSVIAVTPRQTGRTNYVIEPIGPRGKDERVEQNGQGCNGDGVAFHGFLSRLLTRAENSPEARFRGPRRRTTGFILRTCLRCYRRPGRSGIPNFPLPGDNAVIVRPFSR